MHSDVSNWHVVLLHFRVPPAKPRVAHVFEERFVPSHSSPPAQPASTTPFPQPKYGIILHSDASNLHVVTLHFRVPPDMPGMAAHVLLERSVPSHCSLPSATPFPQVVHSEVSNWHIVLLHFRVPPVKPRLMFVQLLSPTPQLPSVSVHSQGKTFPRQVENMQKRGPRDRCEMPRERDEQSREAYNNCKR